MAHGHKCVTRGNYIFISFKLSFLRSGVEAKRGVSSVTQHAMPPEFGGKWETDCLNAWFPLLSLLRAE